MDIQKLLQSLLDHKVKFLVIGAWAMPTYGYYRMTQDVDIFIKPTKKNAQQTMDALKAVGYEVVDDVDYSIFLSKKVLLRQHLLQTDIHPFVAGVTFDVAWSHKVKSEIKGKQIYVPSLNDLIVMKKAAGRDKDKQDLTVLRKIQRDNNKKK